MRKRLSVVCGVKSGWNSVKKQEGVDVKNLSCVLSGLESAWSGVEGGSGRALMWTKMGICKICLSY